MRYSSLNCGASLLRGSYHPAFISPLLLVLLARVRAVGLTNLIATVCELSKLVPMDHRRALAKKGERRRTQRTFKDNTETAFSNLASYPVTHAQHQSCSSQHHRAFHHPITLSKLISSSILLQCAWLERKKKGDNAPIVYANDITPCRAVQLVRRG